jgi:hypothetical protein
MGQALCNGFPNSKPTKEQTCNFGITMVHVPLMFLPERREFSLTACLAKKLDDSSRLDVVEIAHVA